jgi:SAM-dependent methyltransferase
MTQNTSWEKSGKWYAKSVGQEGQYFHQHVILPNALRLLNLKPGNSLLDLACGQGVLARSIPPNIGYLGLDISPTLIKEAQKLSRHHFQVADIGKPLPPPPNKFSHAAIILALQNIDSPNSVIQNAANYLNPGGYLLLVLNHPCFRIPRQSSWGIDTQNKLEYRRINRYLSPLKIPVTTHPGIQNSPVTWSFHNPLSFYTKTLTAANFVITGLEEWASDKESVGHAARMENRARSEFPLFLALLAQKNQATNPNQNR